MYRSIQILVAEHRAVANVLACLERLVDRAAAGEGLDAARVSEVLDFLHAFADQLHQDGEEEHLFPALFRHADPAGVRYIERLAADHDRERRVLAAMSSHLMGARFGEPLSLREFLLEARRYVELQQRHLTHENVILLPMAQRLLTLEDDRELCAALLESPERREHVERADRLCEALGVQPEDDDALADLAG